MAGKGKLEAVRRVVVEEIANAGWMEMLNTDYGKKCRK